VFIKGNVPILGHIPRLVSLLRKNPHCNDLPYISAFREDFSNEIP